MGTLSIPKHIGILNLELGGTEETSQESTGTPLRVLMVTSQWPDEENPNRVPFIVRQVDYLREAGVHLDVFYFIGRWHPIRYLKAAQEVRRRAAAYDVVHARFAQAGLVALPQKHAPVVITYGGTDVLGRRNQEGRLTLGGWIQQQIAQYVARRVDANIVVSQNLAEALSFVPTILIPDGIDMRFFKPMDQAEARQQLGLSPDAKIVVFVGDPQGGRDKKRYGLAKEVVELAQQQIPELELVAVYGRPHSEMPLFMNAADVLLLTSRSEGSPNVVKEALACNTPVVSVDVGDVRERLEHIEGCAVSDSDAPEAIVEALVRTVKENIAIDGRTAVAPLDEYESARKTIGVYQQVLGRG